MILYLFKHYFYNNRGVGCGPKVLGARFMHREIGCQVVVVDRKVVGDKLQKWSGKWEINFQNWQAEKSFHA